MKVTIPERTVEITRCYHECPFFGLDGGPSGAMHCDHPSLASDYNLGYIISHPDCSTGFPAGCPLVKQERQL